MQDARVSPPPVSETEARVPYRTPELKVYGNLSSLTQNGGATIGDLELGSIMDDGRG